MFTKEQLISLGIEKLADIILSLSQKKKYVQKKLEVNLAVYDSDPNKIVSLIKEMISSLGEDPWDFMEYYEDDFVNYEKSRSFLADQINEIRIYIMEDIILKSPSQAIELLLCLLDSHENILADDGDKLCRPSDAYHQVCIDLSTAFGSVNSPVEDVVKIVYDRYLNNDFGIYDDIISNFKDVLGDEGFQQLRLKFEQSLNEKNATDIKKVLKSIADFQNNVDTYIQACSFADGQHDRDHLEIVRRLIKHQRSEEAIRLLDSSKSCYQKEGMALKIEALNLCGKYEEAQAERLKLFDISLSSELYNEILKHAEVGFCFDSWKNTAIQKVLETKNSLDALNFFVNIQEFEQAAKLVYQKIDTLHLHSYSFFSLNLRSNAEKLCEIEPLAATLLYRNIIEQNLMRKKSYYWGDTAKDLAACHMLSSKITDWKGYKNHELYFKEISIKYKKKRSVWSHYTSELNNQMAKRQKMTE